MVAVWVGMVGRGGDARGRILAFFNPGGWIKVPLYVLSGGGVAMVFQMPEARLVSVQAFIIGCTWPAVVANYLSGRQTGVPEEKEREAEEVRKREQEIERLKGLTLPKPTEPDQAKEKLETLLKKVEQLGPQGLTGGEPGDTR